MADENKYCDSCKNHCYLYSIAFIGPAKDSPKPIPGKTPEGQETADIRPYCLANFIPAPDA